MALYVVQKTVRPYRGGEVECYEFERDGAYVTSIDLPPSVDMNWYRTAAMRVRALLLGRQGDASPQFGARADDESAMAFAEMLNA